MTAIRFDHVDVIFGTHTKEALKLLDQGLGRAEILKRTGQVLGVEDACLDVNRGEICVLMGLSGSGKSSLLRCINGLNKVSRGKLLIEHEGSQVDIANCSPATLKAMRTKRIAMVFQKFALMPWLTVAENVGFGLEMQGRPAAERKKLIDEKLIKARAVFGFWPANQVEHDDLEVYGADGETLATLHHLRQQTIKPDGKPNLSLADFVAPKESGVRDYIGGFITTAGIGAEEVAKAYEAKGDDYNSIMVKALADRLAEACAEWLHERVRKEYWGYARDEHLDNEALIKEQYVGIRPAPGYPACPDHTEKGTLFELLDPQGLSGVSLTEHYAMFPAAAVSGWYFAHPQAQYFAVGKIDKDQVERYSQRKGQEASVSERWLAPNLGYDD